MKRIIIILYLSVLSYSAYTQNVGIGTSTPAGILELKNPGQYQPNLLLSGQEYFQAGNASTGIAFLMGINRPGNKHLWLLDADAVATPSSTAFALRFRPGLSSIDAISTDATVLRKIGLGNDAGSNLYGNVNISSSIFNTALMKLHIISNSDSTLLLENSTSLNTGIQTSFYFKTGDGAFPYTGSIKTTGQNASEARMGFYTFASSSASGLIERMSILDDGRVGIGTTLPAVSAKLEVSSTSQGFLPPRVTHAQKILIPAPAAGLMVWCSDCGMAATGEMQVFNGTQWTNMTGGVAIPPIGGSYGGGKLAYIFQPGDPGYIAGQFHGIIAAPADEAATLPYGCSGFIPGADGTVLGTGNQNTIDILATCNTPGIAAKVCGDLVLGGFSDWFLPSQDELIKLYLNRVAIGGFGGSVYYWSSTESGNANAIRVFFGDGSTTPNGKNDLLNVRAIRVF